MIPVFLSVLLSTVQAVTYYECPSDWITNDLTCYKFVFDPKASYEQARASCGMQGTSLLSISNKAEHDFINNWLLQNDLFRNTWYTSAIKRTSLQDTFVWGSNGFPVSNDPAYWLYPRGTGEVIVYEFNGVTGTYGWRRHVKDLKQCYICEISQAEAYRLTQEDRGFDYGQDYTKKADFLRGPKVTLEPGSVVVVSKTLEGVLETRAIGNPQPTYKWYKLLKGTNQKKEVSFKTDSRYTLTNGKITIQKPNEDKDTGDYQCEVENKFGKVFSNPVSLSFGYLGEFSNVKDAAVYAYAFDGAVIQCSKINYKPAVVYNWQRGEEKEYIFSEMTPYIFISSNGRLYFSEVTRVDEREYYCQVTLTGDSGSSLGTEQAPSKTSLGIYLSVRDQAAKTDWGPQIQNDFVAVFPQPPLRGHAVRLECFAYGSAQNYLDMWKYWWTREELPMPKSVEFDDFNRVMIIRNARLEDQGTYTCHVSRGNKASDSKSIYLTLEARPYFIIKLKDQHVDKGSQLTWRCEANGYPTPTYQWYKNGFPLQTAQDGSITVTGNTILIKNLDKKKHDGMYQCSATNVHGTSFSSAQLRVLSFAPTFKKFPLQSRMFGGLNGNITIPCKPEAAPKATITWAKNGGQLSVRVAGIDDGGDRIRMFPNGYLHISGLAYGDAGYYSCKATNDEGEALSGGRVDIKGGIALSTYPPKLTTTYVNDTAFLPCAASYDKDLDLIYKWTLNGYPVDFKMDKSYEMVNLAYLKGLYVKKTQFNHMGEYTCTAITTLGQRSEKGYLLVKGPPGEPAGVFVDAKSVSSYSMKVQWFPGKSNGPPILFYVIQSEIDLEEEKGHWKNEATNILATDTIQIVTGTATEDNKLRAYVVTGLKPGNGYRFRVQAVNELGFGTFSRPSDIYQTNAAAPSVAPTGVRGGGGSVATLTMLWDKLKRIDHGGPGVGYHLYWRMYNDDPYNRGINFNHREIKSVDITRHTQEVGIDNYYLLYEVKIQAFNNYGRGPNSTVTLVYSAEGMPVGAPKALACDGYNSTAMLVTWVPVPDTREYMKGRVKGYQINYWFSEDVDPIYKQYIRYPGQVDQGVVIGLWADSTFWFQVQVYNSAGLGPVSEKFIQETLHLAPGYYPQEVHVFSHDSSSVFLKWRGVTLIYTEAILLGYYIYLWPANEHYRTAKMIEVEKFDNEGYVLQGIEKGKVYAVRIAGFSDGGEGKKSPTVFFTLGGQVPVDPTISEIRAGCSPLMSFSWTLILCFLLVLWLS